LLGHVFVDLNCLDDLVADAVHRVETREWVLEDHRQVLTAHGLQLVARELQEVAAHENDLAGDVRRLAVDEPERSEAGDALARPGLADDPERLAPVDLEGQAVDGLDDPVGRGELDSEVADLEQCLARRHYNPAGTRLTNTSRAGRGRRTGCPPRGS
jgi:hypothetical protein